MQHDHIAILTSDFEQLNAWYKEKLGFEITQEWTVEFMPGMRLAYLSKNDFKIEIIGDIPATESSGEGVNPIEDLNPGYNHFGIKVENIESILEDLKQKGVEAAAPVMDIPQAGIKAAIITDIDGNFIEGIGVHMVDPAGLRGALALHLASDRIGHHDIVRQDDA